MHGGGQSLSFKPLSQVSANEVVSVYGRVLTCKPPRKTRGTDYSMTLFISDGSVAGDVSVNIFRPQMTDFPPLTSENTTGTIEVVQLRRFKAQSYGGAVQLLSCQWSGCTVFYKDDVDRWMIRSASQNSGDIKADSKEIEILDHLIASIENRNQKSEQGINPISNVPVSSRPLLTVRDLAPNIYFDLNCQVVEVLNHRADEGQLFTVLVTDYTKNDRVHFESSEFDQIPSYMHNALLHVTVWDNFVPIAQKVMQEGACVCIKNLHARSNTLDGSLVAVLHGDPRCSRPHHFITPALDMEGVFSKRREELERLEELSANHLPQVSLTRFIKQWSKLMAWSRLIDIAQSPQAVGIFKTRATVKSIFSNRKNMYKITLQDSTSELEVAIMGERVKEFFGDTEHASRLSRSLLPSEFCVFSYLNARGQRKYQIFNTRLLP